MPPSQKSSWGNFPRPPFRSSGPGSTCSRSQTAEHGTVPGEPSCNLFSRTSAASMHRGHLCASITTRRMRHHVNCPTGPVARLYCNSINDALVDGCECRSQFSHYKHPRVYTQNHRGRPHALCIYASDPTGQLHGGGISGFDSVRRHGWEVRLYFRERLTTLLEGRLGIISEVSKCLSLNLK